jgi:hypothetical protein
MLSQLSYHGSILVPDPEQFTAIETIINNFVKGSLRVAKHLINADVKKGGLGMINVRDFLVSQQCSWVKRAHKSYTDGWRTDINDLCNGDLSTLNLSNVNQNVNPLLFNICSSFYEFKKHFYVLDNNFLLSPLGGNPHLINNRREKIPVRIHDFDIQNMDTGIVSKYSIGSLLDANGQVVSINRLNDMVGFNLDLANYANFSNSLKDSVVTAALKNVARTGCRAITISDFLAGLKRVLDPLGHVLLLLKTLK